MNPPFALKKGDEKEYKFIDFALNRIEKNGYLFAVIPSHIMFSILRRKPSSLMTVI